MRTTSRWKYPEKDKIVFAATFVKSGRLMPRRYHQITVDKVLGGIVSSFQRRIYPIDMVKSPGKLFPHLDYSYDFQTIDEICGSTVV